MMDYEKIIHSLIDPIIEEPDSVLIRINKDGDKDLTILIASEKEDTARLIGRRGIIANSIREIVSVGGKSENIHVHVKFESFDEEVKED